MTTTDAVQGLVLTPGDPGYEDARRPFNAAVDTRPAVIVQVAGTRDVAAVLGTAARTGRLVAIRGTGHHLDGRALSGDVVVDLSALRGVAVDPDRRTATVRAGTTWAELDAAAEAHGMAVPGARVSHVGVVGTVLGGGDGWLSIRHGLSADNLLHADVVTGDGRLVRASADAEHELFWALCGGRTDLGVVMSMTLALHPLPATVLGGMLLYPLQDLGTVLDTLRALHAQGCREFAGAAMVMAAPPASFVPGDLVGRAVCAVLPAWFGDVRAGHDFVAPLRTRPRPLVDAVGEQAYTALQAGLDGLSPWGLRQASRASVLRDLPPQLAADVVDAAMALPTRGARISISRIGGAMARPNDAAAYPWRSDGWLVNPTVQWRHRRHDARNTAWLRQLHADVRRRGEVATSLNHESANSARVAWLFGLDRWTRLQATKAAWDPTNLFAQGVTA